MPKKKSGKKSKDGSVSAVGNGSDTTGMAVSLAGALSSLKHSNVLLSNHFKISESHKDTQVTPVTEIYICPSRFSAQARTTLLSFRAAFTASGLWEPYSSAATSLTKMYLNTKTRSRMEAAYDKKVWQIVTDIVHEHPGWSELHIEYVQEDEVEAYIASAKDEGVEWITIEEYKRSLQSDNEETAVSTG